MGWRRKRCDGFGLSRGLQGGTPYQLSVQHLWRVPHWMTSGLLWSCWALSHSLTWVRSTLEMCRGVLELLRPRGGWDLHMNRGNAELFPHAHQGRKSNSGQVLLWHRLIGQRGRKGHKEMPDVALNIANSTQEDSCFWGQWMNFQRWWCQGSWPFGYPSLAGLLGWYIKEKHAEAAFPGPGY